nr:hypothetical protein [Tanacetum cinerariifolium]
MNNKKHIINLETFRDMLHVCPRLPGQSFDELPFKAEILEFLRNIDYASLTWEDFVYQIEHKKQKKGIEMYYPIFTKDVIHHFMSKDLSIPRRNKINWHYVRDDNIFSTFKVVSRHQDTQQYGVILPIELTNEDIRNTMAYKEYYAYATGVAAPKPKASSRKKKGNSDTSLTPPIVTPTSKTTAALVPRLSAATKGKQSTRATTHTEPTDVERTEAEQLKMVLRRSRQKTHISQQRGSSTDEGTGSKPRVPDVPSDDSEEELLLNSSDDEDVDAQDEGNKNDESDDGSDDGNDYDDDGSEDKGNDEEDQDLRLSEEAKIQEEEEADELYHEQQNLYKALVEAYDADKNIMDTYGESTILKQRREDDDQEGPSAGSDRGSKRQREGGEHTSASTPYEIAT